MANKKNAQKGQGETARTKAPSKADKKTKAATADKSSKAGSKNSKAAKEAKNKKGAKPGLFARAKKYLGSVRTEMRRVTWPSKKELINYSVAVCISLIVVGVVIAALDMVIGEGLALFSGLRG